MLKALLALLTIIHLCLTSETPPITDADADEWFSQFGPGINFIPATCAPSSITAIKEAMNSTADLAQAAINAAANFGESPFNKFFLPTLENSDLVAQGMQRVIDAIHGRGVSVGVMCYDISELCDPIRRVLAYTMPSNTRMQIIVYCPAGLAHPVNPPPCTRSPGLTTISEVTLHEFWHFPQISGTGHQLQDEGQQAADVMAAVAAKNDTTNNAQAYALLGSWSYDLGLLDVGADGGGHTCLENINTAFLDYDFPIKVTSVQTYCLLKGPSDFCGLGFECLRVQWSNSEVLVGTEFGTEAPSEIGICFSVNDRLDYTG